MENLTVPIKQVEDFLSFLGFRINRYSHVIYDSSGNETIAEFYCPNGWTRIKFKKWGNAKEKNDLKYVLDSQFKLLLVYSYSQQQFYICNKD